MAIEQRLNDEISARVIESDGPLPPKRRERRTQPRSRTVSIKRLPRGALEQGRLLWPDVLFDRPATRGECLQDDEHAQRPCPFVSCKHHLYLDVNKETGSIKLNFPHLEVWELSESCALDVADAGGITLEELGSVLNLTRERIRQLERVSLDLVKRRCDGCF